MTAELYIYLSIINLCIFLSVYPSIYLSFYLFIFFSFVFFNFTNLNISETLSWQPSRRISFLSFTFTLIQIKNRMMTRQMTTMNQRMRCLRKQRGVPQPIKTFLSEILWHKFQTCLLMKTLGSKPNTMYGFHSQYNYYIDLHGTFLWICSEYKYVKHLHSIKHMIDRTFQGVSYIPA